MSFLRSISDADKIIEQTVENEAVIEDADVWRTLQSNLDRTFIFILINAVLLKKYI